jgi:hypothetical protein
MVEIQLRRRSAGRQRAAGRTKRIAALARCVVLPFFWTQA